MKPINLVPAMGGAVATTFSLFYMMQSLVAGGDVQLDETPTRYWIDPVQRIEEPTAEKVDRLVRPDDPVDLPDQVDIEKIDDTEIIRDPFGIPDVRPTHDPRTLDTLDLAQMDGERIPVVRVAPPYPRRCQERGISGWVVLDFDVTELGTVENAAVAAADPSGCFNKTALKTIQRFKYKPTILDGQPRRSTGVRFRMGFNMEEG